MENILELQQVSKTFPGSDFALDNVSFALPYGAVLGFVGENGAGKTTTIGCILNTVNDETCDRCGIVPSPTAFDPGRGDKRTGSGRAG